MVVHQHNDAMTDAHARKTAAEFITLPTLCRAAENSLRSHAVCLPNRARTNDPNCLAQQHYVTLRL
jgi:hypothetical protein